ncbi:MAG: acetyl-coenzyme A synthetase N-terminal domain-containing protein, partial [Pedococcus sp.]
MPPGGTTVSESSESQSTSQTEVRDLSPTPEFAAQANGQAALYDAAAADFEGFWADQARQRLTWAKDFDQTLDWSGAPFAKWYVGGELNAAYNCVDRHVEAGNGDRVAIHFEGEGGDSRTITYADLQRDVAKAANALESL